MSEVLSIVGSVTLAQLQFVFVNYKLLVNLIFKIGCFTSADIDFYSFKNKLIIFSCIFIFFKELLSGAKSHKIKIIV